MWWLDQMPAFPMDGELTMGRGTFQKLMSTCRRLEPNDADWMQVKYHVFDLPDLGRSLRDGNINVPNFQKEFSGITEWLRLQKICKWTPATAKKRRFETVVYLLNEEFKHGHPRHHRRAADPARRSRRPRPCRSSRRSSPRSCPTAARG